LVDTTLFQILKNTCNKAVVVDEVTSLRDVVLIADGYRVITDYYVLHGHCRGAEYCDEYVSVYEHPSLSVRTDISETTRLNFTTFSARVAQSSPAVL